MSDLVDVADAAFPFDYARLPSSVVAVGGYVGQSGETPHVWSTQEADKARAKVGAWFPIWVPPQGRMTSDTGEAAARGMLAACPQYDIATDCPMFFDVERASADVDLTGARDAINAFTLVMRGHGFTNAHGYNPDTIDGGWVAHYVPFGPVDVPYGCVGQQWLQGTPARPFDLSVFRPSVFAPILPPIKDPDMPLDKDDKAWIVAQLAHNQANVLGRIDALHAGKGGGVDWPVNLHTVAAQITAQTSLIKDGGTSQADAAQIATAILATLGPAVAGAVVTELGKRLAG